MRPEEEHLREVPVSSEQVLEGSFLQVHRDRVRLSTGSVVDREYIKHPGAVMVVPLLDAQHFIMERQFRYPLQRVLLEFPAGKIDRGEAPFLTGVRELLEETGYRATDWALAGRLHNAAAYSDEFIEIWFARGLQAGSARLDADELLDVCEMDLQALRLLAARGELTDAKTQIGLLWLEHWVAGRWQPHWKSPASWCADLGIAMPDSTLMPTPPGF